MNFYIPFETALQFLTITYLVSVMLLLAASSISLVVETIKASDD